MELFGWIIRQVFNDAGQARSYQYLSSIRTPDDGETEFGFLNSQHNAQLLETSFKDAVLAMLSERWPASRFEAKELFWQAP